MNKRSAIVLVSITIMVISAIVWSRFFSGPRIRPPQQLPSVWFVGKGPELLATHEFLVSESAKLRRETGEDGAAVVVIEDIPKNTVRDIIRTINRYGW
ncbi:hypothetical protein [Dethiobacter alkaliphilus]|uniref:Uncharacterized protein n=1 Tax=Dethiobacter alkaliphilus AHT 1 TaxID=555088 RepID=C0GI22_DETAL|nr:hypothetical protein [Dethiobacter alkaliphilus]EEG77096.1 hypothetical protein DealDRAFT_2131 [Dethiobacter alkaliphilus AHT 1]